MRELIDRFRRADAGIKQTIEVYEILEERFKGPPQPENVIIPLLYQRAKEYNDAHRIVNPIFIATLGGWLARRYPGLEQYFIDEQGMRELRSMGEEMAKHLDGPERVS